MCGEIPKDAQSVMNHQGKCQPSFYSDSNIRRSGISCTVTVPQYKNHLQADVLKHTFFRAVPCLMVFLRISTCDAALHVQAVLHLPLLQRRPPVQPHLGQSL